MKEHIGWAPKVKHNHVSGFKNRGPFVEQNTDFEGGDYHCMDSRIGQNEPDKQSIIRIFRTVM